MALPTPSDFADLGYAWFGLPFVQGATTSMSDLGVTQFGLPFVTNEAAAVGTPTYLWGSPSLAATVEGVAGTTIAAFGEASTTLVTLGAGAAALGAYGLGAFTFSVSGSAVSTAVLMSGDVTLEVTADAASQLAESTTGDVMAALDTRAASAATMTIVGDVRVSFNFLAHLRGIYPPIRGRAVLLGSPYGTLELDPTDGKVTVEPVHSAVLEQPSPEGLVTVTSILSCVVVRQ